MNIILLSLMGSPQQKLRSQQKGRCSEIFETEKYKY